MGTRLAIALMAIAMLSCAAEAQENVTYSWYEKSQELFRNGSYEESVRLLDRAVELSPEDATLWSALASGLSMAAVITQNQSMYMESLAAYDRAIMLEPGNTTHLLWKGHTIRQMAYGSRGENRTAAFEDALSVFDRALEIDPEYGEAWAGKGVIFDDLAIFDHDPARYNDSLRAYDKAIELTPSSEAKSLAHAYEGKAVALSHLAGDLSSRGMKNESMALYEEAVGFYDKAIELDPDLVGREALQNRAGVLGELGRQEESSAGYEASIDRLNRSIEENPGDAGSFVGKGLLYMEQEKYQPALEALDNATMINPEYVLAWLLKGNVLSEGLGRHSDSLDAFEMALELDPDESRAWADKGRALESLGRYHEAVLAYNRALEIDPEIVSALQGLGKSLRNLGRYSESVKAYDRALSAIENNPWYSSAEADAWSGRAQSLEGMNRSDEAASAYNKSLLAFERSIEAEPTSAKAWSGKGDLLQSIGRPDESTQAYEKAIQILSESIEKDPGDVKAWWLMAECLDALGRSDLALEAYDRVIDLNPAKAREAWVRKSDILTALGMYNESADAFGSAVELLSTNNTRSTMTAWWEDDTRIITSAWMADGQVLRVTSGWYNRSSGGFENILQINSDSVSAMQRQGTNWVQYYFQNEDTAESWYRRGLALGNNGSYEEALEAYDRATGLNQSYAPAWSAKGALLFRMGRKDSARSAFEKAIDLYNETLEKNPGDALIWIERGVAFTYLGMQNESIESREKALEIFNQTTLHDSDDARAWSDKAFALAGMGRYGESIEALDKVIELTSDPTLVMDAWRGKAMAYAEGLQEFNRSLEAWERAIELTPADDSANLSVTWGCKARTFDMAGRFEEALMAYEKVTELKPTDVNAWIGKGFALNSLGRYTDAEAAFDGAINASSDSTYWAAWFGKGQSLLAQKRYDRAISAYDRVIEQNPTHATSWNEKGRALEALGRTEEADAAYAKAKELGHKD